MNSPTFVDVFKTNMYYRKLVDGLRKVCLWECQVKLWDVTLCLVLMFETMYLETCVLVQRCQPWYFFEQTYGCKFALNKCMDEQLVMFYIYCLLG
ncbi:hypothetical protein HanRHA438_Chr06g0274541 [Helianthus annuus]|nr:hypothetical protein HanRHA438_Chr06g0274541 [Helianthus annuus]